MRRREFLRMSVSILGVSALIASCRQTAATPHAIRGSRSRVDPDGGCADSHNCPSRRIADGHR